MKKNYLCLLTFLLLIPFVILCGQSDSDISLGIKNNYPNPLALSPNSSSLNHNNIDLFHGSLSVSIPLYTLKSKFLSVPISLNYSPPVKKSEEIYHPGWTGLGWNLSAGGVITRNLRGRPDENVYQVNSVISHHPLVGGDSDPEDEFRFNFCGHSGTFFYSQGRLILDSQADILYLFPLWSSEEKLSGFTIQTTDGIIYTFGHGRYPSAQERYSLEQSRTIKGKQNLSQVCTTAWYLTSIQSPEGDVISFRYDHGTTICSLSDHSNESDIKAFYSENGEMKSYYHRPTDVDEERTGTFITPSYLVSIDSESSLVSVHFGKSVAFDKNYPASYTASSDSTGHFNLPDSVTIANARWYKLFLISLKDKTDNNRVFKQFNLTYREYASEVLKLDKIRETGVSSTTPYAYLPPYSFTYSSVIDPGVDTGIEVLKKLTYPTGGYDVYHYGLHYYNENGYSRYRDASGLRIDKIESYASSDETPWVTNYSYQMPEAGTRTPGTISSGVLGRKKYTNKSLRFSAMSGVVEWIKTTNYDMYPNLLGAPGAGQVGYSSVFVQKSRGSDTGDLHHYTFRNYSNEEYVQNGQRFSYQKMGQLLSVSSFFERTDYDYDNPDFPADTLEYRYNEYMPFNYVGNIGTGTYSKKYIWLNFYIYRKYKPYKITKYVSGNLQDTLSVTTLRYNPETYNVISSETENKKEGSISKTEYRYQYDSRRDFPLRVNVPYEVIYWKDGKVTAAEVTHFSEHLSPGGSYQRPTHKYIYRSYPYPRYTYSVYNNGEVIKSGDWKEMVSYEYYPDNSLWKDLIKKETSIGSEPVLYEWDNYFRLKSVVCGDMKTEYTYNIHGITSVKEANGMMETTEYDSLGRPVLIRDTDGNILKKIDYQYNLNQ